MRVGGRASRTQYQYTLQDANLDELRTWAPQRARPAAQAARAARTSTPISRPRASSSTSTIDRDTASRLGITPQAIDDTLYDAFGQRQVATIYTQLNQYRVVLEVKPEFQRGPERARRALRRRADGRAGAARARSRRSHGAPTPLVDQPPGPVPGDDAVVQPRARRLARRGRRRDPRAPSARSACPPASTPTSRARRRPSSDSLASEPMLILAALAHRLHRARHALRELHPPDHDPVDAAVGGRRRAARAAAVQDRVQHHRAHRHHPAHRHREEERDHDDRLRASRRSATRGCRPSEAIYKACLLRFRPIMMTTWPRSSAAAARARPRHRLRAAPAARHRHRRRPRVEPARVSKHDLLRSGLRVFPVHA